MEYLSMPMASTTRVASLTEMTQVPTEEWATVWLSLTLTAAWNDPVTVFGRFPKKCLCKIDFLLSYDKHSHIAPICRNLGYFVYVVHNETSSGKLLQIKTIVHENVTRHCSRALTRTASHAIIEIGDRNKKKTKLFISLRFIERE